MEQRRRVYYGFNEDERPFKQCDDDASWYFLVRNLKTLVMTNMERRINHEILHVNCVVWELMKRFVNGAKMAISFVLVTSNLL